MKPIFSERVRKAPLPPGKRRKPLGYSLTPSGRNRSGSQANRKIREVFCTELTHVARHLRSESRGRHLNGESHEELSDLPCDRRCVGRPVDRDRLQQEPGTEKTK